MANKKILIDIRVTDAQASTNIKKTTKAVDGLAKSTQVLEGRTRKNKATSGLNNTILQESGRLASDAAYGFQGMANNLGQLVSLFQISAKNSGGFVKALQDLKSSFFGVGGILIGVQLLISFLPQIQRWFEKSAKAASKFSGAFDDLSSKVGNAAGNFEIYIKTLQSSTKSEKEKADAILNLNKEFPDYILSLRQANISLDDVKNQTDEATIANNSYRESIIKLALSQAAQSKIQEIQAEVLEKSVPRRQELIDLGLTEQSLAEQQLISISEFTTQDELRRDKSIQRLQNDTEEHNQFIANKDKEIKSILDFVDIQVSGINKVSNATKNARVKELDDIGGFRTTPEEEDKRNKAVQRIIEKGFGETFAIRKKGIKKESDLWFKDLKDKRDAKDKDAKEDAKLAKLYEKTQANKLEALAVFTDGFSQLLGEQSAAGKAFASATALIDTYAAVMQVWSDKTLPYAFKVIASAGVLATGISTVQKINAVDVSGRGQSSAAGGTINAPNFNVVGTSETSQLAQAVGRGNQNSVVKAYVVGSEITSQQEFDRKITNTAGL